jgi:hypothetical protein
MKYTLILAISLLGCSEETTEVPEVVTPPVETMTKAADSSNKMMHSKEEMEEMQQLAVEKRVAFMSGHVVAGLTLYRAGAPEQASKHLLHPVSETHAAERAGIDALGFKGEIFESVSKALEDGKPASEVEPMLKEAETNIALLQKNAGGDASDIIRFLMETVDEEYAIGVQNGKITDPGEYQDAYGFSVVAHQTAQRMENAALVSMLETLVGTWPENGPLADSIPASVKEVTAHTAKIILALTPAKAK